MEFKGTKGKWTRFLKEKTDFYNRRNEIHFGNDGECIAEFVHNDFDALLISKAPEMLNALIEIERCFSLTESVRENLRKLIKEATKID